MINKTIGMIERMFAAIGVFQGGKVTMRGKVHIMLTGPDGAVKCDEWNENSVVTVGKYHAADQLSDSGEAAMSHMAVGTGTNAVADADTTLQTELDRNALDSKTQGTSTNANKVTYITTWAAGDGTGALTESGIFNAASGGTMLCRSVFSVKNKEADDSLVLTWVLTLS